MSWPVGSAGTHQLGVASRGRAVSLSATIRPQRGVPALGQFRDRAPLVSRMHVSCITHVASQTPATTSGSAPSTSTATEASQPSSSAPKPGGQLLLSGGAFVLPHPEKMAKGGEDWYFISPSKRALGVADGVGGWAEVGVDAGAYARQLMGNARDATDRVVGTSSSEQAGPTLSAQDILEAAYTQTKVKGSSTACVIVVNGSTLIASNLGDSGFMVMRDGAMLMSTSQQQHSFNFPFQIGAADDVGDHPRAADRYEVQLMPGDIIVAGTDGLWDNCFHEEVVSVLKYCEKGKFPPSKAAQVLAHYARHRASDSKFASPFAYSAYQEGIKYLGGKMDDITVVLAFVERPGQQQQQQGPAKAMAKL